MSKEFDVICLGAALVDMVAKVERHPAEDDEVFVSDLTLLSGGAAIAANSACGIKKSYSKITENGASDEKKAKHIGSIVGHAAVLVGFAWYANKFKSQIATFLSE